jgi:hypothetical protein
MDQNHVGEAEAEARRRAGLDSPAAARPGRTPEGHPDETLTVDPTSAVGSPLVEAPGGSIHSDVDGFVDAGEPTQPQGNESIEG